MELGHGGPQRPPRDPQAVSLSGARIAGGRAAADSDPPAMRGEHELGLYVEDDLEPIDGAPPPAGVDPD